MSDEEGKCDACGACEPQAAENMTKIMKEVEAHCKEIARLTAGNFIVIATKPPTPEQDSAIKTVISTLIGLRQVSLAYLGSLRIMDEVNPDLKKEETDKPNESLKVDGPDSVN